MTTIKINGEEYKVKYTLRALFIFEQITGKPFQIVTLTDNYLFFLSMILANNPDCKLDWDSFIEAIDNDPDLATELSKVIENYQKKENIFDREDSDSGEKKS